MLRSQKLLVLEWQLWNKFDSVCPLYDLIALEAFCLLLSESCHFLCVQLVSNAIQFLASVAERPGYKHLFEDANTLSSICEKVIVPNMEFRGKMFCIFKQWLKLLHVLKVAQTATCRSGLFTILYLYLHYAETEHDIYLCAVTQMQMKRHLKTMQRSTLDETWKVQVRIHTTLLVFLGNVCILSYRTRSSCLCGGFTVQ